jgi:hypothetical protein
MGSGAKSYMRKGFLKVWWQDATLFVYFDFFCNIHTFIQSQYIHPSPFAEASLLIYEEMRKYFPIYEEADSHI